MFEEKIHAGKRYRPFVWNDAETSGVVVATFNREYYHWKRAFITETHRNENGVIEWTNCFEIFGPAKQNSYINAQTLFEKFTRLDGSPVGVEIVEKQIPGK